MLPPSGPYPTANTDAIAITRKTLNRCILTPSWS
jgi:hypothetical protein